MKPAACISELTVRAWRQHPFAAGKLAQKGERCLKPFGDVMQARPLPGHLPSHPPLRRARQGGSRSLPSRAQGFSLGLSEGRIWVCPLVVASLGAQQDVLTCR